MSVNRLGRPAVIVTALGSVLIGLLASGAAGQTERPIRVFFPVSPYLETPATLRATVAFDKPTTAAEQRVVLRVQLRSFPDDVVLAEEVLDNSGHGIRANSESHAVEFAVPGDVAAVYVSAWAVPWSLNRAVVDHYNTYPMDGTYRYAWISNSYGVTQDLYYLGTLIAPTIPDHTTYCSGITFETFLLAWQGYNTQYGHDRIAGMSASSMQAFRRVWYGVTDVDRLVARAISDYGVGEQISDWEEVQEGDFVQLWRHSGSGHSVVFLNWERNTANTIIGFRYWSTQSSTNGIGIRSEFFGETSGVNPARFWPGRLRKPRDDADFDWALGQADTRIAPIYRLPPTGLLLY